MRPRAQQIRVTLALMLLGAAAGSLVATGILAIASTANKGFSWSDLAMSTNIGCRLGILIGVPVGPALGFNAFRHIPIGRGIVAVTAWPLAGAVIGALIDSQWTVALALIGLIVGPYWATRRQSLEA
jgi:hypothetical protein